jgi:predicted membrane chloride channel (bestrophin family)
MPICYTRSCKISQRCIVEKCTVAGWVQVLSELIEAAPISDLQKWQMHDNLTTMHDVLGGCERILRTPIPVAYTRHTSRFVIIWLSVLPYALWSKVGWATVVIAPLIGVLLLGINEIGIDVEEPFSLLPLEAIADRCYVDIKQSIELQARPDWLRLATLSPCMLAPEASGWTRA